MEEGSKEGRFQTFETQCNKAVSTLFRGGVLLLMKGKLIKTSSGKTESCVAGINETFFCSSAGTKGKRGF